MNHATSHKHIVWPCSAATVGSSQDPDLSDVRIYKRSNEGVAPLVGRTDSTGTLGSAARTTRSPAVSAPATLAASTVRDYPELVRRQLRWDSFTNTPRSSVRASATSSPAAGTFKGSLYCQWLTQWTTSLVICLIQLLG